MPRRIAFAHPDYDRGTVIVIQLRKEIADETSVTGVILAGTQPWGACALERVVPRALAPIANRALLTHVFGWLADGGICSASICGNSYTEDLRRRLTKDQADCCVPAGIEIDYYEDLAPRGPAGCVRDAGLGNGCETLVVVDGSLIPQVDLRALIDAHLQSNAVLTVVVSSDSQSCGFNGEGCTPMGIYVFSRVVLEHISPNGYQDIKESLIPHLFSLGMPVVPYPATCPVPRVTNVDSYLAVNGWMLKTLSARSGAFDRYRSEGYRLIGDAGIHVSASVDSTARLIGPILVGEGSHVGRGVTIIGPTSIGPNCRIGEGAVICRTSMWDECTVESDTVLDRCIVSSRSIVQCGSAYRYVVFSERQERFAGLRHWFHRRAGSNGSATPREVSIERRGHRALQG